MIIIGIEVKALSEERMYRNRKEGLPGDDADFRIMILPFKG